MCLRHGEPTLGLFSCCGDDNNSKIIGRHPTTLTCNLLLNAQSTVLLHPDYNPSPTIDCRCGHCVSHNSVADYPSSNYPSSNYPSSDYPSTDHCVPHNIVTYYSGSHDPIADNSGSHNAVPNYAVAYYTSTFIHLES